jgi:EF hand
MRLMLIAALFAISGAASAQTPAAPAPAAPDAPPPGGAEARAKLMAADANKDGKWDKAEWLAAGRRERGFQMIDADSDGFVTQAELKDGMARMQARRAGAQ